MSNVRSTGDVHLRAGDRCEEESFSEDAPGYAVGVRAGDEG